MSLFSDTQAPKPLAERMRPRNLEEVLGQKDACAMLYSFVEQGQMPSLVFWGPPGSGKTTLSRLMASLLGWEGRSLNATSASVKDIREMTAEARQLWAQLEKRTLLFIDEINRLNKAQQDVLLPFVEAGTVVLAGSTTENPYFSITGALRSRVQLVRLLPLTVAEIREGLHRAVESEGVEIDEEASAWISMRAAGDLRLAFSVLESAALMARCADGRVTLSQVAACLDQTNISGDRKGDNHFDLASAFQKSLRGSDANAAVYYLARFLATGEDPRFIASRILVTASEDVGNADPKALQVAIDTFHAVQMLGLPECRIPLTQAAIYIANAPKSNESIIAIEAATTFLTSRPLDPIPAHLRDSHYQGAAELGHGKGYIYSHDNPEAVQEFMPVGIKDQVFVTAKGLPKDRPDARSLQWLFDFFLSEYGTELPFEIDTDTVAQKIQWPPGHVRSAVNALVQEGRLAFKRTFRISKGT